MELVVDNISDIEIYNSVDLRIDNGKAFLFWNMYSYCKESLNPIHTCNVVDFGYTIKHKGVLIAPIDYNLLPHKRLPYYQNLIACVPLNPEKRFVSQPYVHYISEIVNERKYLVLTIKISDLLCIENNNTYSFKHIGDCNLSEMKDNVYFNYLGKTVSLLIGFVRVSYCLINKGNISCITVSSMLSETEIFNKLIESKKKMFRLKFNPKKIFHL